jgi:hypothetical protein
MRSLWRMIALRWLGGHGSEALTDDSALLDLLIMGENARAPIAIQVRRQSGVSHHAMMARQDPHPASLEPVIVDKSGGDRPR